jgi:hypothetical protein
MRKEKQTCRYTLYQNSWPDQKIAIRPSGRINRIVFFFIVDQSRALPDHGIVRVLRMRKLAGELSGHPRIIFFVTALRLCSGVDAGMFGGGTVFRLLREDGSGIPLVSAPRQTRSERTGLSVPYPCGPGWVLRAGFSGMLEFRIAFVL